MRVAIVVLVVLALLGAHAAPERTYADLAPFEWMHTKNFTRIHGMQCAMDCIDGLIKTVDSRGNWVYIIGEKDGCITVPEIPLGKKAFLKGYEQMAAWVKSDTQIMRDCNNNTKEEQAAGKPLCIDVHDMELNTETCLKGKSKLRMFKKYICDRCHRTLYPDN